MTVRELEEFLQTVSDKGKSVFFYHGGDNPFNDGFGVTNAFEVSRDKSNTGSFEGVYLQDD